MDLDMVQITVTGYWGHRELFGSSLLNSYILCRPARTNEEDYVNIVRGDGCWSHVGRQGGVQELSIGHGCLYQRTIIHEFVHALG